MANLLATANNWTDAHSNSPPSWWNGTAYVIDDSGRAGVGVVMTSKVAPNSGDTFGVTFQNFASPNPPGTTSSLVLYTHSGSALQTWSLIGANGPTNSVYTFNGTEGDVYLQAFTVESGSDFTTYQADFSLTPYTPVPVAANESTSVAFNSQNNSMPYGFTEGGSPVTPTSFAVVSQPTNGTASVSGTDILYTPNENYNGADSFTYNGVYGAETSNTATISVFVNPFPTPGEVRLRWTDDGGHNWSNFMSSAMGARGQTANRVIFRRLGSTRESTGLDRVFEISSDAYTQTCLVGASFIDG